MGGAIIELECFEVFNVVFMFSDFIASSFDLSISLHGIVQDVILNL